MMIGEHLKKVRNSKNLTQKEMAAGIVNRSFYSRVENGSSSITADNLMKILYRHELSMTDFLYNFGNTKPKLGVYQDRRDCQIFCVNSSFSQIDFLIIYSK